MYFLSCFWLTVSATFLPTTAAMSSKTALRANTQPLRVGIAGTGAIGLATAALLNDAGHKPILWSTSSLICKDNDDSSDHDGSHLSDAVTVTGKMESRFHPLWVTSPQSLVEQADVVMLCLPANGHKTILEHLAPHLQPHQSVIISSHASFGALYLRKLLLKDKHQTSHNLPVITAWGTTVATARRPDKNKVRINTIRQSIDCCAVPDDKTNESMALCKTLFPQIKNFVARDGLVAISLSNLNPQNHLGIALGNISRMEKGEDWYQSLNITPAIGRLLEQLDTERLAIAAECQVKVKTIFEHFSLSFHVPRTESIADMNQQIHVLGNDVFGPNTANSRYILEDVPFGLVPTVVLGRMVGKPATLHEAGIQLVSAMYGRDFMQENDLLRALQLDSWTFDELSAAAKTGNLASKVPKATSKTIKAPVSEHDDESTQRLEGPCHTPLRRYHGNNAAREACIDVGCQP